MRMVILLLLEETLVAFSHQNCTHNNVWWVGVAQECSQIIVQDGGSAQMPVGPDRCWVSQTQALCTALLKHCPGIINQYPIMGTLTRGKTSFPLFLKWSRYLCSNYLQLWTNKFSFCSPSHNSCKKNFDWFWFILNEFNEHFPCKSSIFFLNNLHYRWGNYWSY